MNILWSNYFFPFLTFLGFSILFYTIKNLLPSYFSEKGKNLATTEDISKITTLVEEVKHSFNKETENLKANLQILTNVQVGIVGEERNAIIDYNIKYFRWLNMLLDVSIKDVDISNDIELDKYMVLLGDSYRDLLDSATKFSLFVENEELIKIAGDLKIKTLEFDALPSLYCLAMQRSNADIEYMKRTTPMQDQLVILKDFNEKRNALKLEFSKQISEHYKRLVGLTKVFTKVSRDHIYKLIKN